MLLLIDLSFHSTGITGLSFELHLMIVLIWEAITLASPYLPTLFKCRPCLVKCFLLNFISTKSTWLNNWALLISLLLKSWVSRLIWEFIARSCLIGMFTIIIVVCIYFWANCSIWTKALFLFLSVTVKVICPSINHNYALLPWTLKFRFLRVHYLLDIGPRFDETRNHKVSIKILIILVADPLRRLSPIIWEFDVWLTVHRSSVWIKKATRCHLVLYLFLLYKSLNTFRATLCPSSGADELVVFFHVWFSAVAVSIGSRST